MHKRIFLFALVFTSSVFGCSGDASHRPSIEAFEVSKNCPNVCWLGISPGATSANEATAIVMNADEIEREQFFKISESGIQTIWKTDKSNTFTANVWINFDNDIVKSINFGPVAPFTVNDFASLLGEPNKIVIKLDRTIDGGNIVMYAAYFSRYEASIFVYPGSWNGPNPDDYIESLVLNAEFTYPRDLEEELQQPWLGYEHLQEYLPGQDLPSGPYTSP